jgi:Domain of unknown function (DUF4118)
MDPRIPPIEDDDGPAVFLAVGPLAAILLGMALVPFRALTSASNFAFAFMALTIVVAEFGGRWASVATAVCSGLSLDFFLTRPYLALTIAEKHDVITVVGLTACGLVAAAFASQRGRRSAALAAARQNLDLLHAALSGSTGRAADSRLVPVLRALRGTLPLAAAVVRDQRGGLLAGSDPADGNRPVPEGVLETDTLATTFSPATGTSLVGAALPDGGGRIALVVGTRRLGWLDVWGNGQPVPAVSRRTLNDVARTCALLLAACPDDTEQP